jgi:hypothetical protein
LNNSLIVIVILNSDDVGIALILTAICCLIYPFAIILSEPIEVNPDDACSIGDDSLGPIEIDGYFVIAILDIDERCCWVGVAIDVILLFRREE